MANRKIIRIRFFAIKRELESTNRRQEDIAADYGVSSTTVSAINNARTWENFLVGKKAQHPIRSRVKASDPVVRKEKAEKAGLHPVTAEQRRTARIKNEAKPQETPVETAPQKSLDELTQPVLRGEFRHVNGLTKERLDAQLKRIRQVAKSVDTATVTSFVALFLSFVAFVISIIAMVK